MTLPTVAPIREIEVESRTVRTFVLDMSLPQAEPGQFVLLWLPGVDEKPMSIADPDPLTLTVTRIGPFSTALHRARVGSLLGVRGPHGHGFSLHAERPALLVAGGCGAAPLYFLARRATEQGIPTTVVLGARCANDLIYANRFRALGVDLLIATDDGSLGFKGTAVACAAQALPDPTACAIYACGPERMLAALLDLCTKWDVPGQFSVERYMKCGFGVCGQCALDGLLVCQDGPVLTSEQLRGLRDFGRFRRSATGRKLPVK